MSAEIIEISNELNQDNSSSEKPSNVSMNNIVKLFQSRKMGAIWITLIVVASTSWTLWNISHFQSSLDYKNELIKQELQIENEIQEIIKRTNIVSFNDSEEHRHHAESRVFKNYTKIAEWLHEITVKAQDLGFKVEYKMANSESHDQINEIDIVPIEIEVFAWNKVNIESYYQKHLVFLEDFFKQHWYIKLNKAGMENISGDSSKLFLSVEVFMWENENITGTLF